MNFDVLRQKILEKAIRGELVPQLESEPAVEQIGNAPEEVPFEIPKKWKWVQLKTIFAKRSTINPVDYGESKVELWSIPAFDKGKPEVVPARLIGSSKKVVVEGDVLLSKIVPHIKRAWVVSETNGHEKLASTEWIVFHSNDFFPNFLTMALTEPHFHSSLMSTISGMGSLKRANPQKVGELYIPCPSLAEQRRVVARLNDLLALIETADIAYKDLHSLCENFRAKLIQKAIEGKLVPQLESEPEVKQIGEAPEEVPFEIPKKWKWVQLSSAGKIVGGGTPKTGITAYWGGKISWVTPADLGKISGRYISFGAKSITQTGLDNSSARLLPPGSVVYSSRAPIGHIAIAENELCTNQGCKSFVPNLGKIRTEWGYFCLIARTPDIISRASGTTFKEISGSGVGATWIPLPPLAEQRRIVARLNKLLASINQLGD